MRHPLAIKAPNFS